MKKLSRRALAIMITLVVVFAVAFTACGGGLSGTWEDEDGAFTFSGKTVTYKGVEYHDTDEGKVEESVTGKGTYSITGNKIEFVWNDGKVAVYDFSRTENTFKLSNGNRLYNGTYIKK